MVSFLSSLFSLLSSHLSPLFLFASYHPSCYLIPPFLPHAVVWLLAGWMLPTAAHSLAHSLAGSLDNSLILFPFRGEEARRQTSFIFLYNWVPRHHDAERKPLTSRPRAFCFLRASSSVVTAPRCCASRRLASSRMSGPARGSPAYTGGRGD